MDDREVVLAWLAEDRSRGYRAAAREFGIDEDVIREWKRGPSRARARDKVADPPVAPAHETESEFLRRKMAELELTLTPAAAERNMAAYVAGTRLVTTLRQELAKIEAPPVVADPTEGLSDAEVVAELVAALSELPLPLLDDVLEGVGAERVPASGELRLVEGGEPS